MFKKTFARSLASLPLILCLQTWGACASQGGAPTPAADLSSMPARDLADAGASPDLNPGKSILWLKQLGASTNMDMVKQLAVDPAGNLFVACQFAETADFGDGPRASKGDYDVALVKLTPAGELLWVRQFGGTGGDWALRLVVDRSGDVVISGRFEDSINFGAGPVVSNGRDDYFLAKYAGDGRLLWAKGFGSTAVDSVYSGLAVDGSGNVYFAGTYGHSKTPVAIDLGGGPLTSTGYADGFLAKFSPGGTHIFSKHFGGTGIDYIMGLAVDQSGDILIGGQLGGTVDLGGGPMGPGKETTDWGFVARLSNNGAYKWAAGYYGEFSRVTEVAVDPTGATVVTGIYNHSLQTRTASLSSPHDGAAGFLVQLDATGTEKWARGVAIGSSQDTPGALAMDSSRIYLGGLFVGPANFGLGPRTPADSDDSYLVSYSLAGTPQWDRQYGGPGEDSINSLARTPDALYVGGHFSATVDFGGGVLTAKGWRDGFVMKLPPPPPAIP